MPLGSGLQPYEPAGHTAYFSAPWVGYPTPQLPMQPNPQHPAASWSAMGASTGGVGAVDEEAKGAHGLSLLNRVGSYGGGVLVPMHEVSWGLPAVCSGQFGNIRFLPSKTARPSSLQGILFAVEHTAARPLLVPF